MNQQQALDFINGNIVIARFCDVGAAAADGSRKAVFLPLRQGHRHHLRTITLRGDAAARATSLDKGTHAAIVLSAPIFSEIAKPAVVDGEIVMTGVEIRDLRKATHAEILQAFEAEEQAKDLPGDALDKLRIGVHAVSMIR